MNRYRKTKIYSNKKTPSNLSHKDDYTSKTPSNLSHKDDYTSLEQPTTIEI
jgi:hypothetical protein